MEDIKNWWFNDRTQRYLTLIFMIGVIYLFRSFMPTILLIIIFASIGISGGRWIKKWTKLPYVVGVTIFYIIIIFGLFLITSFVAPMFYKEVVSLIQSIIHAYEKSPKLADQVNDYLAKTNLDDKITSGLTSVLHVSLQTLQGLWKGITETVLALLLSFVYAISLNPLKKFGRRFQTSEFPRFFSNIFELSNKFVYILGQIIRVQIVIDLVNTTLSVLGFLVLGMPSALVLGSMVLVLGLIPVAGVLISMIPLTIVAFSAGGWILAGEVLAFILVIHTFEAYVLHPKLMASRSDLPVFVTFISLIVMERILGPWGLILGVPIVAFFLDVFDVHAFSKNMNDKNS
ncbi:AI-2E family transporter [Weissella coleopterorum]|uniref:AI-2E family transporter n=1 Tax=Weissella coleopterorum TaxID=2714949 RepID=A0A6G8B1F2_9LACO|nr:AI-2E family transporter [Weissella coleopterorum]QIL51045.1 AI-2E family transporter [Weissella coleopterorum]